MFPVKNSQLLPQKSGGCVPAADRGHALRKVTCSIFLPVMEPLRSITKMTFLGSTGISWGAK